MPVDREVTTLKDRPESLEESNCHVVVKPRVSACNGRVPLVLCEARHHDVGNPLAPVTVVGPTDDILREIERSAEFRAADYKEVLFDKRPRHFDRRKEVFAVRILSNAEQDGADLNEDQH